MSQAGILSVSGGGGGGGVTSVNTDAGTATPTMGVLNIVANTALKQSGSTVSFSGSGNTVLFNISAANNMLVGALAGNSTVSGVYNTAFGTNALSSLSIGNFNIAVGINAGSDLTTGSENVFIGPNSGTAYDSSESNNICIGYNVYGVALESNTIRIGAGANQTFISGINGVNVGSIATVVTQNNDQLGTATITAGTGITVTPGSNTITIAATGGITSIGTDLGSVTPAAGVFILTTNQAIPSAGSTVFFSGSGNAISLNVTNVVTSNTIIGAGSGNLAITGFNNTVLGANSADSLTTGFNNTVIGQNCVTSLTSGSGNTFIGQSSAINLINGTSNTIIGYDSVSAYNGNESSNIIIGRSITGVSGESHVLRIGSATGAIIPGNIAKSFIAGIRGITTDISDGIPVFIDSNGQLGTSGGSVILNYTSVPTDPYVVLATDNYISVDTSGGPITIQFPNAATIGKTFIVKDRAGTAASFNITVTTVGGVVNIDGAPSFVMNSAYQSISIIGNGSTYELY